MRSRTCTYATIWPSSTLSPSTPGSVRRRVGRFALAAAVIAPCACASTHSTPPARLPDPTEPAASAGSAATGDSTEMSVVIHVVNTTTQLYRLSLAFGASARVLGSVPALEARDFIVPRRGVLGYDEFSLVAVTRNGTGRRDSELFPLSNVSGVDWTLDGILTRSVKLR